MLNWCRKEVPNVSQGIDQIKVIRKWLELVPKEMSTIVRERFKDNGVERIHNIFKLNNSREVMILQ